MSECFISRRGKSLTKRSISAATNVSIGFETSASTPVGYVYKTISLPVTGKCLIALTPSSGVTFNDSAAATEYALDVNGYCDFQSKLYNGQTVIAQQTIRMTNLGSSLQFSLADNILTNTTNQYIAGGKCSGTQEYYS